MMKGLSENMNAQFRMQDMLQRLILINVGLFLFVRIVNAFSGLFLHPVMTFDQVSSWLAIPAFPQAIIRKPWTVITYMFYHWDFLHLLFNMLWLYWMGRIMMEYLGAQKLLATYLLGGISGALLFIAAYNFFPAFSDVLPSSFALGASASVLAITVAAATLVPDYPIQLLLFGTVRLKYIAIASILIDLMSVSSSNAGGHIAHIGGAIFGFVYIKQLRKGRDLGKWIATIFARKEKKKMKVLVSEKRRAASDESYREERKAKQERMDEILDKINRSGYGSLTNEEKEFLFRISKEG